MKIKLYSHSFDWISKLETLSTLSVKQWILQFYWFHECVFINWNFLTQCNQMFSNLLVVSNEEEWQMGDKQQGDKEKGALL